MPGQRIHWTRRLDRSGCIGFRLTAFESRLNCPEWRPDLKHDVKHATQQNPRQTRRSPVESLIRRRNIKRSLD
jgi:hypothetical protein